MFPWLRPQATHDCRYVPHSFSSLQSLLSTTPSICQTLYSIFNISVHLLQRKTRYVHYKPSAIIPGRSRKKGGIRQLLPQSLRHMVPHHVSHPPWVTTHPPNLLSNLPHVCQGCRARRLHSKFSNFFSSLISSS